MEHIRNRIKQELIKEDDNDKLNKQQSKLTFDGIYKSYTNYDSYIVKKNEIFLDKPIYLGFAVSELSKFLMYKTYYDKFHHIWKKNFKVIISIRTHFY